MNTRLFKVKAVYCFIFFCGININTKAQKPYDFILKEIDSLNYATGANESMLISNRALNLFLGQKLAYYLSGAYIGIDIYIEKCNGKYNPINAGVGFPVTLTGKKEDDFLNFEILLRASDHNNTIQPDKNFNDKLGFQYHYHLTVFTCRFTRKNNFTYNNTNNYGNYTPKGFCQNHIT